MNLRTVVRLVIVGVVLTIGACSPKAASPSDDAHTARSPSSPSHAGSAAPPASSPSAQTNVVQPDTIIAWSAKDDGNGKVYHVGGLTLQLGASKPAEGDKDDGDAPYPTITVSDGRRPPIEVRGEQGFEDAAASFGVGRLDPRSDGDQVLFMTYTGGAHCCTHIQILTPVGGAWKVLDLPLHDGEALPDFPPDVRANGARKIWLYDDRFAYAFAPYAGSVFPPRVYEVYGGEIREISQARSEAAAFEKALGETKAACLKHENAACAAFVADAARLGRKDWAWRIMLDNYDPKDDWGLGGKCMVRVKGQCPKGEEVAFKSFPEALESFLVDTGYIKAADAAFPLSAPIEPSFNCAASKSAAEKLVCATPELIAADHDLSIEFAQALANSADPEAVRASQRAWLQTRDAAPPDAAVLKDLYSRRIQVLAKR